MIIRKNIDINKPLTNKQLKMLEKMETAGENEKENYKNALTLGIKAFIGEVRYNED